MFMRYPVILKTHPDRLGLGAGATPMTSQLASTLRLWRARARMRGELRRLDERVLQDIGLSIGEADLEAAKPFWME